MSSKINIEDDQDLDKLELREKKEEKGGKAERYLKSFQPSRPRMA